MSRLAIHQVELKGFQTQCERVWNAIQALAQIDPKGFSKRQIQDHCKPIVRWHLLDRYVARLCFGGYIKPVDRARKQEIVRYVLLKAQPQAPIMVRAKSDLAEGSTNEAMWRAMKVLPSFDHHDLARAATLGSIKVPTQTAASYVRYLAHAGYLTIVRASKPGTAARYRLTRNTGPYPPAITRRKVVFDRNTGEFANLDTAQEVCDGLV